MTLLLPSSISSRQDLMAVLLEIRGYAKWFAHNAIKERVHAKHATPPPVLSQGAMDLVKLASSKKLLSTQDLEALIDALETYTKTASTVTITLAAPATGDIRQTLVGWCRENIAPSVLVSFKFNANLLGGMVIHHGSHVFDWSFRRELLAKRAAFPEVLRRV